MTCVICKVPEQTSTSLDTAQQVQREPTNLAEHYQHCSTLTALTAHSITMSRLCTYVILWTLMACDCAIAARQSTGHQMYLIGGESQSTSVEMYDFEESTWRRVPDLPSGRFALAAATLNGTVYAIGGTDNFGEFASVSAYDPEKGEQWTEVASMVTTRQLHAATTSGGKIYVTGGMSLQSKNTVEVFSGTRWQLLEQRLVVARYGHGIGVLDDGIYVFGGDTTRQMTSTERMDLPTGRWSLLPVMLNTGRFLIASAVTGNRLYAIGGWDREYRTLSSVEVYDQKTGNWSYVAPMNKGRHAATAQVYGGQIYVVGGTKSEAEGSIEIYDPVDNKWTLRRGHASLARTYAALAFV